MQTLNRFSAGDLETWRGFPPIIEATSFPRFAECERNSAAMYAQETVAYWARGNIEAARICFGSYRLALKWAGYYERFTR